MGFIRTHIIFRIFCFALALSSLAEIALHTQQVPMEVVKEMNNNVLENLDDSFSKHELPSAVVHVFKNAGLVELVYNYCNHYALQFHPEITPPPPKHS